MDAKNLIALIYRPGKGCRQYPFDDFEKLEKFCGRHPYRYECLEVMAVCGGRKVDRGVMPAADVVEFVRKARAGGAA